jgi:hypothetical protein
MLCLVIQVGEPLLLPCSSSFGDEGSLTVTDLAFPATRSDISVHAQVAGLGFLPSAVSDSATGGNKTLEDFPPPLCKLLSSSKGGGAIEVVHLHVRSAADVGGRRMLAVRDRLRRDTAAAERYNALQIAGARGELTPASFECARRAFYFAAASDMSTIPPDGGTNASL